MLRLTLLIMLFCSNVCIVLEFLVVFYHGFSLENRSQSIFVNGATSKRFHLQHGAPQGSCFGPLLFLMYASDLFNMMEFHLQKRMLLQMIPNCMFHSNLTKMQMNLLQSQLCKTALMTLRNGCLLVS